MRLSSVISDNCSSFTMVESFIDKEKYTDCTDEVTEDIVAISSVVLCQEKVQVKLEFIL